MPSEHNNGGDGTLKPPDGRLWVDTHRHDAWRVQRPTGSLAFLGSLQGMVKNRTLARAIVDAGLDA